MRFFGFLFIVFIIGTKATAQDYSSAHTESGPKSLIYFDPIFWKDQLKLSSLQQKKIDRINYEFYENLKKAYSIYGHQESSHYGEIKDLLANRSEQIWETFHGKQKRKWEKLDTANFYPNESGRTQSSF